MMIGEGEDNTNHYYVFHSLLYALIESAKHEQIEAEETVDFRLRQDTEKYPKYSLFWEMEMGLLMQAITIGGTVKCSEKMIITFSGKLKSQTKYKRLPRGLKNQ